MDNRIRALFIAEFTFTTGMATLFLLQSLPFSASITHIISGIGAALLYFLASARFLSRILSSERLMLDKQQLSIIRSTLFRRHTRHYEWQHIGMLHYSGIPVKTDHPLKGKCFDYFGFDTQEHVIQSLHHEGNLYFEHGREKIFFARGVYSWDAEEMVNMMKLFVGAQLHLGPEWAQMLQPQEVDGFNKV